MRGILITRMAFDKLAFFHEAVPETDDVDTFIVDVPSEVTEKYKTKVGKVRYYTHIIIAELAPESRVTPTGILPFATITKIHQATPLIEIIQDPTKLGPTTKYDEPATADPTLLIALMDLTRYPAKPKRFYGAQVIIPYTTDPDTPPKTIMTSLVDAWLLLEKTGIQLTIYHHKQYDIPILIPEDTLLQDAIQQYLADKQTISARRYARTLDLAEEMVAQDATL